MNEAFTITSVVVATSLVHLIWLGTLVGLAALAWSRFAIPISLTLRQ